ncbi:SEL1-like repeat protein [Puniceibacterium sp. IMCC21224]|uniref:SEL1-like repeat protein n=1 Tax=Puniceibacterium sp. IMCC21224 TaxID=1618204 RepID=UPI00065CE29F|nr:tetratricopeptide repeat protein [Puniceibacterium sp. IMCC21224]KMK64000.1 TPR repeat-containing protein [Puniceibacterium sp. IMCC21224]
MRAGAFSGLTRRVYRAVLLALIVTTPLAAQDLGQTDIASLQQAATGGDIAAQIALAERYHTGTGVPQNYAEAAAWYSRAAQAGDPQAQNALGRYAHAGLGVKADRAAALRWLGAAADSGNPQYLFDYASVLEQDPDSPEALASAAVLYQRAADAGHEDAAVSLGVLYQNGRGVAQDLERARALYAGPAEAGNARAQNNLGLLYARGSGVPQDYERAVALFTAAADQGLTLAMTNLGVMYENGFGVPHDEARAASLYRMGGQGGAEATEPTTADFVYDPRLAPPPQDAEALQTLEAAAQAGDPVAQIQTGWLLANLAEPTQVSWQAAAGYFAAAATKGHAASMANLAQLYVLGRAVPQDYVLAQMWLVLAGSAGLPEAAERGAALATRMTPAQINEAQARAEALWQGGLQRPEDPAGGQP